MIVDVLRRGISFMIPRMARAACNVCGFVDYGFRVHEVSTRGICLVSQRKKFTAIPIACIAIHFE